MGYHHGNDPLNNAIIKMAQDYPGARNLPNILPVGNFGNRILNKSAGAPRYIDTKLNKD